MPELTYNQIYGICLGLIAHARRKGFDEKQCVFEMSPSIRKAILDYLEKHGVWVSEPTGRPDRFCGVVIRRGVTDEETGILLKRVNGQPWQ